MGRGFPGDLRCRAPCQWGLPLASRRFVHLIPESLRRDHAGLMQRFLRLTSRVKTRLNCPHKQNNAVSIVFVPEVSMKFRILLAVAISAALAFGGAFAQQPIVI